jgi:phage gp16-like protein
MITRDQIKLIWVLARQLGMESDELHDVVSGVTGKNSIRVLSVADATDVIEVLVRAGGRIRKKRKIAPILPSNVVEIVTRKQSRLIREKGSGPNRRPSRSLKG